LLETGMSKIVRFAAIEVSEAAADIVGIENAFEMLTQENRTTRARHFVIVIACNERYLIVFCLAEGNSQIYKSRRSIIHH
jgi:hypothetical protein